MTAQLPRELSAEGSMIRDGDGRHLAPVIPDVTVYRDTAAIAAEMVKRWNAYGALVDALKEVKLAINDGDRIDDMLLQIDAALKWTAREEGVLPTVPGLYRVMVSGDSESIDGHQIYAFDPYETFMQIGIDQDGDVAGTAEHDETFDFVIAWYGPIDIPICDCFLASPP